MRIRACGWATQVQQPCRTPTQLLRLPARGKGGAAELRLFHPGPACFYTTPVTASGAAPPRAPVNASSAKRVASHRASCVAGARVVADTPVALNPSHTAYVTCPRHVQRPGLCLRCALQCVHQPRPLAGGGDLAGATAGSVGRTSHALWSGASSSAPPAAGTHAAARLSVARHARRSACNGLATGVTACCGRSSDRCRGRPA